MTDEQNLPDNTLTTAEIPNVYANGPYTVGRSYYGRVAHIYTLNLTKSLCRRYVRIRGRLDVYFAGDATCKECLKRYRKL